MDLLGRVSQMAAASRLIIVRFKHRRTTATQGSIGEQLDSGEVKPVRADPLLLKNLPARLSRSIQIPEDPDRQSSGALQVLQDLNGFWR